MEISYKPILPKKPYPIVILGAGGIVRDAHLPAYASAGFEVAGIYDLNEEHASALAKLHQIPQVCKSLEEAIQLARSTNAVFDLATPPQTFLEILPFLPDKSGVLIQKPMGNDFEESKKIVQICRDKQLTASINFQLRWAPFVSAARKMIDNGYLGELYDLEVRLTTYTPWEIFPSVVNHPRLEIQQHSIHYIDMMLSFLGEPKSVLAKTLKNPAKPMSSTRSTIILDYGDTMHAVINTNHDHNFGPRHQESFIKWEGTKGVIKAKMGLLLNYPVGVPDQFEYCISSGDNNAEWTSLSLEGTWFPDAFVGSMSSLMRYMEGSSDHLPTHVDKILDTMAVVEGAYNSSSAGGVRPSDLINS